MELLRECSSKRGCCACPQSCVPKLLEGLPEERRKPQLPFKIMSEGFARQAPLAR